MAKNAGNEDLLTWLKAESGSELAAHSMALALRNELKFPAALVWHSRTKGIAPDGIASNGILSASAGRRIKAALQNPRLRQRAESAISDRRALSVAMEALLDDVLRAQGPSTNRGINRPIAQSRTPPIISPQTCFLYHTSLGGPKVAWRGRLAMWAYENGIQRRDVHISFTHDGDAHICVCAWSPGLKGLGVDAVYLPRLTGEKKGRSHFDRFARKFMSPEELRYFQETCKDESVQFSAVRAAAHFSLMESASKSLGTGLKIGGGMGRETSLPKQALNVANLLPVKFSLTEEAVERMHALKASRLEGYWAADSEYLVSLTVLW